MGGVRSSREQHPWGEGSRLGNVTSTETSAEELVPSPLPSQASSVKGKDLPRAFSGVPGRWRNESLRVGVTDRHTAGALPCTPWAEGLYTPLLPAHGL